MSTIKTNQLAHTANGASVYTLPQTDGSANQVIKTDGSGNLGFVSQPTSGLTEVDHFRVSSNLGSANNDTVISNWERMGTSINAALASPHGTGMSISSGVFTFPSTGKYLVFFNMKLKCGQNDIVRINTQVTSDNSSYATVTSAVSGKANAGGHNSAASGSSFSFIDVSDVSQVKVQFKIGSQGSNSVIYGGSTDPTDVLFIRIGDT